MPDQLLIRFELTEEGTSLLKEVSRANIGNHAAVFVDSRLVNTGVIRSELGGHGVLSVDLAHLPPGAVEDIVRTVAARWPAEGKRAQPR